MTGHQHAFVTFEWSGNWGCSACSRGRAALICADCGERQCDECRAKGHFPVCRNTARCTRSGDGERCEGEIYGPALTPDDTDLEDLCPNCTAEYAHYHALYAGQAHGPYVGTTEERAEMQRLK